MFEIRFFLLHFYCYLACLFDFNSRQSGFFAPKIINGIYNVALKITKLFDNQMYAYYRN